MNLPISFTSLMAASLFVASSVLTATAGEKAKLIGGEENPPVVSPGVGSFKAKIHAAEIDFRLEYSDIPGEILQAHIHAANPGQNGSITVFLCTNMGNTPMGATDRPCPPSPGKVEGTIVAGDVLAANGVLTPGSIEDLKILLRQGATYVNVHTDLHPSGEIRGQVHPRKR